MHRKSLLLPVAISASLLAAPALAVAQSPAVDQYTLQLPAAGGNKPLPSKAPSARRKLLPRDVRQELSGADGNLLANIATSPGLGAPQIGASNGNDEGDGKGDGDQRGTAQSGGAPVLASSERGVPAILADALGSGSAVALLLALAAIAAFTLLAPRLRRS